VSQEALAAKAELHRNYVGLLERGRQIPSILVVEKLATALETTMSSLLRDVESDEEPPPLPKERPRKKGLVKKQGH
jgi:transcriptional regulator with XRE-family HTH domain